MCLVPKELNLFPTEFLFYTDNERVIDRINGDITSAELETYFVKTIKDLD